MFAALATDTSGYRLLLLAHLLCVIVGFGSTFVYPLLGAESKKRQGATGAAITDASLATSRIVTAPFIYGAAFFGVLLVAAGPYDWRDLWVQASITLVLVAMAFAAFVHTPNLHRMAELGHELAAMGAPPAESAGPPPQATEMATRGKAAARNGGVLHVLFLVILILMIWKPM